MEITCFECQTTVQADDLEALGDVFLAHARSAHEWPFPDQAVRNYAEATQRLTGSAERLERIGEVVVHPVTEDRIDDWLAFFDHDAFVGTPEWAACYCTEPHVRTVEDAAAPAGTPHWRENREQMMEWLRSGKARGYLAYVDGRPAGWVNASRRCDYTMFTSGDGVDPADDRVVGVACFVIAPPYRSHGVAGALLDSVIRDAADRGADWIEAYPFRDSEPANPKNFRGPRSMFDQRGFEEVEAPSTMWWSAVGPELASRAPHCVWATFREGHPLAAVPRTPAPWRPSPGRPSPDAMEGGTRGQGAALRWFRFPGRRSHRKRRPERTSAAGTKARPQRTYAPLLGSRNISGGIFFRACRRLAATPPAGARTGPAGGRSFVLGTGILRTGTLRTGVVTVCGRRALRTAHDRSRRAVGVGDDMDLVAHRDFGVFPLPGLVRHLHGH